MADEFRRVRRVEFAETDTAGIVHFSSYCCYMEETEHAFLRSLGLSVHPKASSSLSERVGFPRLSSRCEFLRPVYFEDELEIHLRVSRKGNTSLTYQFSIEREGERVAAGELVVVCCRLLEGGRFERIPLPDEYAERIEQSSLEPLSFGRRASASNAGASDSQAEA